MDNWDEIELGNLLKHKGYIRGPFGSALKRGEMVETGIPVYEQKNAIYNLREFRFFITPEKFEQMKRFQVKTNDLIISCSGTVGRVSIINEEDPKGIISQALLILRPDIDKITLKYLFYFLSSRQGFNLITQVSHGSVQVNIAARKIVESIPIPTPPLPEQKAIAEVLSSLDDKIDLLHRQNKTLEAMAETLFRQWFVEEADESWETLPLSEIAEVKNGYAFSSKSYVEKSTDTLEVFKMGHIEKGGGLRTNPKRDHSTREDKLNKYILSKNDIVMAMTDMKDNVVILGVPAMIDKDNHYVQNQRVARIYLKSKEKLISQYLLYVQLNDKENIAILQSTANSGVQVNLSTKAIKDIEIIIPPKDLQLSRGQSIIDLFLKKDKNAVQIQTLTNLRDTLLPKLMSGEVRIKMN